MKTFNFIDSQLSKRTRTPANLSDCADSHKQVVNLTLKEGLAARACNFIIREVEARKVAESSKAEGPGKMSLKTKKFGFVTVQAGSRNMFVFLFVLVLF